VINIHIGGYGYCGIAACCGRFKRIFYITKVKNRGILNNKTAVLNKLRIIASLAATKKLPRCKKGENYRIYPTLRCFATLQHDTHSGHTGEKCPFLQ
jgi:hypothetical protein